MNMINKIREKGFRWPSSPGALPSILIILPNSLGRAIGVGGDVGHRKEMETQSRGGTRRGERARHDEQD